MKNSDQVALITFWTFIAFGMLVSLIVAGQISVSLYGELGLWGGILSGSLIFFWCWCWLKSLWRDANRSIEKVFGRIIREQER